MATWSGIRHRLENEYLAESLKGHIQYFATSYSKYPDHEGRASIMLDGKEIISGSYQNNWIKAPLFPKDEKYKERISQDMAFIDDTAVQLGVFNQKCFYEAYDLFNSLNIDDSLNSDNMLVRIFAILDRRVGKRKLIKMKETINQEDKSFREFFAIRANAEGIKF